jgi:hypothetical protein
MRNLPGRPNELENNYNYEKYERQMPSRQLSNRGSVNINNMSEHGVEYESPNKYRPS